MAESGRIRVADLRAISRLVGECRDLGDDPVGWRTHLLAGLARRTGAGLGIAGELSGCLRGPRGGFGAADWGWDNGFDRAGWLRMLGTFYANPLYNPILNACVARYPRDAGTCFSRPELIPDADWYDSDYYQHLHREMGADGTLACLRQITGRADEQIELYLLRTVGAGDFTPRQKAMVAEAHALIAPMVGGALARFAEPSPADLPPQTRRVLACLLDGDSDKQIAARLGIAPSTVNGHAKRIFAHFGVSTRAELLARWLRRGWGARRAWADGFRVPRTLEGGAPGR